MAVPDPAPVSPTFLQIALQKCRGAFGYAAFFSLCINLLTVLFSLYSLQVLDRVFSSRSFETLLMLTILMVVAVIFLGLFSGVRFLLLDRTGAWLDQTLAPMLLARSIRLGACGVPGAASQQQRDLGNIRQFIAGSAITTFFDAPWSVIYLIVVFAISVPLGWITLVGCIALVALGLFTELLTRKPVEAGQRVNLETLSYIEASSRHAETIEVMGMTPTIVKRWRAAYDKAQVFQAQSGLRSALLQSITRTLRMALQVAVTAAAGYLVLHSELTPGGMIAASILSARAFAPFEGAITFWKQMSSTKDAYKRLNASIAASMPPRGEMSLPAPRGALEVERLSYQPSGLPRPILQPMNFMLQPGESLGIIGPSGAGKSTLLRLITGSVAATTGHVRFDGNDLATWNREDLGPYIGYVPQQAELFTGSIRENIARLRSDASPQSVIDAAELAGVHRLIQQLPMGYDTLWDPSQPALSPGQKQRIALARAVYGNPQLIVLDEPNLNLDGEGEAALVTMLQLLKLRRITVIVVAHKPSIVSCLDKILVLQRGQLERFGAREQVLQNYLRPQQAMVQ
jgi:PrtD family type I secretion system ABC transporter